MKTRRTHTATPTSTGTTPVVGRPVAGRPANIQGVKGDNSM